MPWDIELTEKAALVSMNSNPVGTMNDGFFADLHSTFSSLAENHPSKPVALSSAAKMFSPGLDLEQCALLFRRGDKEEIDLWFERFLHAMLAVLEHPAPVIAAIGGHAIAGGCILALCCDMRVVEEGKTLMGLNEKSIGFPMPASLAALVKGALGPLRGGRIMDEGKLYGVREALENGIVDRVCPRGEVARATLKEAERPATGGKEAKAEIADEVRAQFHDEDRRTLAGRLSSPETVDRIEALLETLKKAKNNG